MLQDVFTFPCPCCGKTVEVNVRSGKARAVRPDEAKGGRDLDSLLAQQKRESERLHDMFDSARDQQAKNIERLTKELDRAKEEAKKDPKRDGPKNVFDLD
jgi:hypothetical protein